MSYSGRGLNVHCVWAWGTLRDNWDQQIGVESELPRVDIPGEYLLFYYLRRAGRHFGIPALRRTSGGEIGTNVRKLFNLILVVFFG